MGASSARVLDDGTAGAQRADLVIDALIRRGVRSFVVCPGSRSTPLVLALARAALNVSVDLRVDVCLDERVAGFMALGAAKLGAASAVITTSGTAVANLLPALAEARRDGLAIIAVCADRPTTDVDAGASQTLPQPPLLAGAVDRVVDLDINDGVVDGEACAAALDDALAAVADPQRRGPVMLNVRFDKPLEPPPAFASVPAPPQPPTAPHLVTSVIVDVSKYCAGLCVVGALPVDARPAAAALARRLGWPVVADVAAGLREHELGDVPLLTPATFVAATHLAPDAVIWLGGLSVLEELPRAVRQRGVKHVVQVAPHAALRRDPLRLATAQHTTPFDGVMVRAGPSSLAAPARAAIDATRNGWTDGDEPGLDEATAARAVVGSVGPGDVFVVGNSMPARDVDRFGNAHRSGAVVIMNRGVAGIDGNIATALGACRQAERPATILLGDVAALHDLSGLCAVALAGAPVRVVVVNNDGGGIFQELPLAASTRADARAVFSRCFLTPHGRNLADVALALGLKSARVATLADLRRALATTPTAPELVEVVVDMAGSSAKRRERLAKLTAAVRTA